MIEQEGRGCVWNPRRYQIRRKKESMSPEFESGLTLTIEMCLEVC